MRTATIELARTQKQAICGTLHPGTVDSGLSGPFAKTGLDVQTPEQSAARLIGVLDALIPSQTGLLFDHLGVQIAF